MAKPSRSYVCQSCGAVSARWAGRCGSCGEWNSITEEAGQSGVGAGPKSQKTKGNAVELEGLKDETKEPPRFPSGFNELDRVLGGGFVPGSAILVGGDPGIGKSTLLLQVAAALARSGKHTVYLSGEEATAQIRLRAKRLGAEDAQVGVAAETSLSNILATLDSKKKPDFVVIDSIQTLWSDLLESAPGTVSQVRAAAQSLIQFAKRHHTTLVLVGHVTKEGQIAGPKVVEHMVDTVLYFEGDRGHQYRILRGVKNRFGATDEIGVFEMLSEGLKEVLNPSELFLGDRDNNSPGAAVFAGIEGTRPVLVEIQALVAPSPLGTPRRAVVGWDSNRLSMILAVLSARCGLQFGNQDVYLNIAGGLRINEPAADFAVAAALVSSYSGISLPKDCVYFGEISLSGGLRQVGQMATRLKEAEKLGFLSAVIPASGDAGLKTSNLDITRIAKLTDFTKNFAGGES